MVYSGVLSGPGSPLRFVRDDNEFNELLHSDNK